MGQRTRDRSFRRLESRSRTTAPIGLAWATGALLGALGGVGFLAWEALVLQAAGLSFAPGSTGLVFLGVYATMGAGIGWAAGATGLWGPRWSSAALILLVSWFLAVRLGQVASQSGAPGALGVGLAVLAGLVLGQLAGRVPGPGWVHLGVASFGLASLALAVPLQQHLLPGASVAGSVLIGVVLLLAVTLAGVVSAFTGDDRAPVVPLALWAALGGIGALVTRGGATPPAWEASTASGPPIVLVVISGLRADRTGAPRRPRSTPWPAARSSSRGRTPRATGRSRPSRRCSRVACRTSTAQG